MVMEDHVDAEDADFDAKAHRRLLRQLRRGAVGRVARQSVAAALRDGADDATEVSVGDLLGGAADSGWNELKKQVSVTSKRNAVLHTPVHRQQRERVHRATLYDQAKADVAQWEPIVKSNRLADRLEFPLHQVPVTVKTVGESVVAFKARTPLELETEKLLQGSKNNLTNKEPYTEAEIEIIKAMSLREAKDRCAKIQRMRALMSYQEAKFRRKKKIKSKQYHRILRRQKRKELLREFDDLKHRDPAAAEERLETLEMDRIRERATLKHRSKTKWAKQLRSRAKNDPAARDALEKQLAFGRELAQKQTDSSDDGDDETALTKGVSGNAIQERQAIDAAAGGHIDEFLRLEASTNPWMRTTLQAKRRTADDGAVSEAAYRQMQLTNEPLAALPSATSVASPSPDPVEQGAEVAVMLKRKRKGSTVAAVADDGTVDDLFAKLDKATGVERRTGDTATEEASSRRTNRQPRRKQRREEETPPAARTSPAEADEPPPAADSLRAGLGAVAVIGSDVVEHTSEADGQEAFLAEAFADDDVLEVFEREKRLVEEEEQPKSVDLSLPGWGSWAGDGVSSKKRKERFVLKPAPSGPRRDKFMPGVIVSETTDSSIKKLQVNQLPFPFTSVDDFESTLKHPIGREWNPECAHNALTERRIITKAGVPILPMDKELTLKKRSVASRDESDSEDD